ncbi:MAG: hypothetical protein ACPL7D_04640 [Candidatus Sumerlaeaceae bacterium]|jgi:Spy/CpxP family protein refolding chaperone
MNPPAKTDRTTVKLIAAVLLILGGVGWTFYNVNKVRPGAVANNGVTDDFRPPSPEEMDKMRREMFAYANITPEQERQLEDLWQKIRAEQEKRRAETTGPQRMRPGGPPGMGPGMMMGRNLRPELQAELDKILTKDQQDKMREFARQRFQQERAKRDAKIKAALGEAEYQRYQEKRRERFAGRGGGRGGGRAPGQQGPTGQQQNPSNPGGAR